MFFKHFASKNQLPGLSVSGAFVENWLNLFEKSLAKQPTYYPLINRNKICNAGKTQKKFLFYLGTFC